MLHPGPRCPGTNVRCPVGTSVVRLSALGSGPISSHTFCSYFHLPLKTHRGVTCAMTPWAGMVPDPVSAEAGFLHPFCAPPHSS